MSGRSGSRRPPTSPTGRYRPSPWTGRTRSAESYPPLSALNRTTKPRAKPRYGSGIRGMTSCCMAGKRPTRAGCLSRRCTAHVGAKNQLRRRPNRTARAASASLDACPAPDALHGPGPAAQVASVATGSGHTWPLGLPRRSGADGAPGVGRRGCRVDLGGQPAGQLHLSRHRAAREQ
jgi:hypothetical protein